MCMLVVTTGVILTTVSENVYLQLMMPFYYTCSFSMKKYIQKQTTCKHVHVLNNEPLGYNGDTSLSDGLDLHFFNLSGTETKQAIAL